MIRNLLLTFLLCSSLTATLQAQDTAKMYAFVNQIYSPASSSGLFGMNIFKSGWGNFLLPGAYPIDAAICNRIKPVQSRSATELADSSTHEPMPPGMEFTAVPVIVQAELYRKCKAIDSAWQQQFRWQQDKISKYLVVKDRKNRIPATALQRLKLTAKEKPSVQQYIKAWNKATAESRLVNYCSIPVFTGDGQYALIIIGQDCRSEGGWDSIFIFKRTGTGWEKLDEIQIATI